MTDDATLQPQPQPQPTDRNYEEYEYDDFDEPLCDYFDGKLLKGIYEYGFEKPSRIQSKTLQPMIDGRDLIAQAQSGSGKTGAFILGAFTKIDTTIPYPQAIIISNTRELTTQIYEVAMELGKYTGIKMSLCIGSNSALDQQKQYDHQEERRKNDAIKQSHIIICTPGKLLNFITRNPKLLDHLKILIMDEADELLTEKFISQIQQIIGFLPKNTQICLFSATSNSATIQDTKTYFMNNPVEIYIPSDEISVAKIKNYIFDANSEDEKYNVLVDLYTKINICQAVIFVNTKEHAIQLADRLHSDNHMVGVIHGDMTEHDRRTTLTKFRKTVTRILVATDIIARGIDIQQVGLVINYDFPWGREFKEQYIHRTGRSGRYGKLGVAINILACKEDFDRVKQVAKFYSIDFYDLPVLERISYYLSGIDGYNFTDMPE